MGRLSGALVGLVLGPACAVAETFSQSDAGAATGTLAQAITQAAPQAPAPLSNGQLIQTAGGLLLVLVLIIGLAWAIRRFGRLPSGAKGQLEILGGLSLGARERVVLLKVADTRLLIGVAPGRVQTLHILSGAESAVTESAPFANQLSHALKEGA
jgi:flagellar protein FliO/FliZ